MTVPAIRTLSTLQLEAMGVAAEHLAWSERHGITYQDICTALGWHTFPAGESEAYAAIVCAWLGDQLASAA